MLVAQPSAQLLRSTVGGRGVSPCQGSPRLVFQCCTPLPGLAPEYILSTPVENQGCEAIEICRPSHQLPSAAALPGKFLHRRAVYMKYSRPWNLLQECIEDLSDVTVCVISHDRAFLDAVTEETIVFRNKQLTYHTGGPQLLPLPHLFCIGPL